MEDEHLASTAYGMSRQSSVVLDHTSIWDAEQVYDEDRETAKIFHVRSAMLTDSYTPRIKNWLATV